MRRLRWAPAFLLLATCARPFGEEELAAQPVPPEAGVDGSLDAAEAGNADAGADASCANGALGFSSGSHVEVPASVDLDSPADLTVEAWVRPAGSAGPAASEAHVVSHHDHGSRLGYVLMLHQGVTLRIYGGLFPNDYDEVKAGSPEPGKWHHIAGVLDVVAQELRVYLDGKRGGVTLTPRSRAEAYAGPLRVGLAAYAKAFAYAGLVDEVRVSSVARYGADFTPAYPLPDAEASTIATWHFAEGAGSVARSADKRFTGTLMSATDGPPTWVTTECPLAGRP